MPKVRYEVECKLAVLSPLHVGSGEFVTVDTVRGKDGRNEAPQVAGIVRDCVGKPYIPGTAIKNLLLRTGRKLDLQKTVIGGLFGTPKDDGMGAMGAVLCRGATLASAGGTETLPYAKGSQVLGPGVFVAARTSIDPKQGSADEHKLFFQEMVTVGSEFSVRLRLEGRESASAGRQFEALGQILEALQIEPGSLGKGQADGNGRVSIKDMKFSRQVLGAKGLYHAEAGSVNSGTRPALPQKRGWVLRMECASPFMILDSSYTPPARTRNNDPRPPEPQLKAQRADDTTPLVLGSSISGALRSRAAWLVALAGLRANATSPAYPEGALDRVFGKAEFRALLQIGEIKVAQAQPFDVTSVKLDRFSGGPIDNALFKSRTFTGVEIETHLSLVSRSGNGVATPDDKRLAQELIEDIEKNGLDLGHGANKGFGWFKVGVTPL